MGTINPKYRDATNLNVVLAVQRNADGYYYDFSNSTFVATPTTLTAAMAEATPLSLGQYGITIATSSSVWTDGNYTASFRNASAPNTVLEIAGMTVVNGSDEPPWADKTEPAGNFATFTLIERLHWMALHLWNATLIAGKLTTNKTDGTPSTTQTYTKTSSGDETISP